MAGSFTLASIVSVILMLAGPEPARSAEGAAVETEVTQDQVLPILLLRCTVCHGGRKQEAELDLRSRASMLRGGKSGPAFVAGKPEESLMLKRIRDEEMPPRKRLVEAMVKPMEVDEVRTLTRWIELGAPELPPGTNEIAADRAITKEARAFWSFQMPRQAKIPNTTHSDLVRNPVDAFVLEPLEKRHLSLAPCADRLTLLRRASFDLTGLPPEPSEIQALLADEAPDAYERLIDRLLASPRYGERWGRHWLDLAGYADCEGRREQHLPRPYAWRYRDYVIRSFNSDKGYDRFLLEQIAGDELADYEHAPEITKDLEDNLVATAFLRMAPDPTWANLTGFVPDRLEVIADTLDVLGSGVMGLTFKCARCHTHKFDPILQRDYYQLAAILKGAYDEHDWLKPEINGFGGALSVGLGERYLPYVTSDERRRWQERTAKIQSEIDQLKSVPESSQSAETKKRIKDLEVSRPAEPRMMALWDRGDPSPTYIYRRGNYLNAGPRAEPALPAVLVPEGTRLQISPPWPGARSSGRRLAFARWLVDSQNPLTARVMINRVWKHHFGRGLVSTLGNFGKMGERPTHPELLDWLACEFMRQGWSLKAMHRLIMTSSTYRQSSGVSSEQEQYDPGNRFLSRMPMRRLEAEELRDTLLLSGGQLNDQPYGPAEAVTSRPDGLVLAGKRRSIYTQQLRKEPVSLLESFDLPAMNPNCLQRTDSLVAPQALHLLNDSTVRELARQFAKRVFRAAGYDRTRQVEEVYWIALSRAPTGEEMAICREALTSLSPESAHLKKASGESPKEGTASEGLITLCHAVMNSAAFLYVD